MRRIAFIVLTMMLFSVAGAQEFRPLVTLNYQKLLTTNQAYESAADKKVFDVMKQAIEEFVGNRHWTNLEFKQNERIECTFSLVLTQRSSATDFGGQLSVQLKRPVYNSTYTTGLFNYMEQGTLLFSFNESQPLDFDPNNFTSNLASTLAFYCYIMLGMYFDSFAPGGGEPMYDMARAVAQSAESSSYAGWRSSDNSKSRYWFMENHTNSAYAELHDVYYKYHRLGLDMMTRNQDEARQSIMTALEELKLLHRTKTNLLAVSQFIDVKIQEIVSIFTPAPDEEKKKVFDIIKEISPANIGKLKDFNVK